MASQCSNGVAVLSHCRPAFQRGDCPRSLLTSIKLNTSPPLPPPTSAQSLESSSYFKADCGGGQEAGGLPPVLVTLFSDPARWDAALRALGGVACFLQAALLDRAVLPLARFEVLPNLNSHNSVGTPCPPPPPPPHTHTTHTTLA